MPVNLNPPPLPNAESIRAQGGAPGSESDAAVGSRFVDLLRSAEMNVSASRRAPAATSADLLALFRAGAAGDDATAALSGAIADAFRHATRGEPASPPAPVDGLAKLPNVVAGTGVDTGHDVPVLLPSSDRGRDPGLTQSQASPLTASALRDVPRGRAPAVRNGDAVLPIAADVASRPFVATGVKFVTPAAVGADTGEPAEIARARDASGDVVDTGETTAIPTAIAQGAPVLPMAAPAPASDPATQETTDIAARVSPQKAPRTATLGESEAAEHPTRTDADPSGRAQRTRTPGQDSSRSAEDDARTDSTAGSRRYDAAAKDFAPKTADLRAGTTTSGPERLSRANSSEAGATQSTPAPNVAPTATVQSRPPLPAIVIDTPVGAAGWSSEVAGKLAQIVVKTDRAELRLDPPELGPVSIRIDMNADSASLTMVAAHPATRDALQQAMPELRDLLASQGISLGQTTVQDGPAQGFGDAQQRLSERSDPSSGAERDFAAGAVPETVQLRNVRNGLVDLFA